MVTEPDALHLRFRVAATGPHEPPLAAFAGPAAARVEDECGVLPGARPLDPDGPIVVFLQQHEFAIPAPGDAGAPDLESWSVRPTTFGYFAEVARPAAGATRVAGPRRAAQVFAGCLALTLTASTDALADAPVAARAPASAPAAASTASAPAPAPTRAATPTPTSETRPSPTTPELPPDSPPATTPPTTTTTTPTTSETARPPPPKILDTRALAEAAWEGIDGFVVVLELKGGRIMRGRVGAVQAETFTFIDGDDGRILVIPKSGVSSLRAYVPPPIPSQTGGGLLAGGSVLTALGVPVFITGIAFVAICPSCVYLHLPMLFVGGGAMGGGIPMISKGIQRRTAFEKAIQEHRVTPVVQRTQFHGWTGGLQFRF
jgi:hypothetical protein